MHAERRFVSIYVTLVDFNQNWKVGYRLTKFFSIKFTESPFSFRDFPVAVERLDFAEVISTSLELLVTDAQKKFRKIS
jgi:hypothetical protein